MSSLNLLRDSECKQPDDTTSIAESVKENTRPATAVVQATCAVGLMTVCALIVASILLSEAASASEPSLLEEWRRVCTVMCGGPIVQAVNDAGLYNDSKTFVDMPLKLNPEDIVEKWHKSNNTSHAFVKGFIRSHFHPAGNDVEPHAPADWGPGPPVVLMQTNTTLRCFAEHVHALWRNLSRRVSRDVSRHPQRHTLMPLPRPFIVAGGRFREPYFWDSLWIIHGLLISNMRDTATFMVENLVWQARHVGTVPNGARAYYTNRSQPPVLALMAAAVVNATNNVTLAREVIPAVLDELAWYGAVTGAKTDAGARHTVSIVHRGSFFIMHRYAVTADSPRPESYQEDVRAAAEAHAQGPTARSLWGNIAAAAESGWDFSSRWLRDEKNTATAATAEVIPADLNAILVAELRAAATLIERVPDATSVSPAELRAKADQLCGALNAVLWDPISHWWSDWNITAQTRQRSPRVTAAAWVPLWARCADARANFSSHKRAADAVTALRQSGLLQMGGVDTSLFRSGQQWDSPSAWSPLQWLLIEGLYTADLAEAKELARELARRWLYSNLVGYTQRQQMLEKYDAFVPGGVAGGGEYVPQTGFGWTNGVALYLLAKWSWTTLESAP